MSAYDDQMNDDVTNRTEDAIAADEGGPPIKGGVTAAEESQTTSVDDPAMEDEGPPIKGSTT